MNSPNNPPNPTPEMIEAGKAALDAGWHDKSKEWEAVIASVYLAMRAAERLSESKTGFRAITPTSPSHAAVLEDLARRIDDE